MPSRVYPLPFCSVIVALGLAVPSVGRADTPTTPPLVLKAYNHALDDKLIKAVADGTEATVKQLLNDGADPNLKDTDKYTTPILAEAASSNVSLDLIKDLIDAGANLEATNSQGATALTLACVDTHPETIKMLLKAGAKVDARTTDGLTPLMYAASAGEVENVKTLMAAGADVNARSTTNGTALIYGSSKTIAGTGSLEIIKMLVEAGADVSVTAANGKGAIETADTYGLTEIADYLRDIYKRDSALFNAMAAVFNDRKNPDSKLWEGVKTALAAGANPRFTATQGRTCLMFIAYGLPGTDDETIKTIVTHSDLAAQDDTFGATALHLAVNNDLLNLAKFLVQSGAPLHALTKKQQTPLDMAVERKNSLMVDFLKDAEAHENDKKKDVNPDDLDLTALFAL